MATPKCVTNGNCCINHMLMNYSVYRDHAPKQATWCIVNVVTNQKIRLQNQPSFSHNRAKKVYQNLHIFLQNQDDQFVLYGGNKVTLGLFYRIPSMLHISNPFVPAYGAHQIYEENTLPAAQILCFLGTLGGEGSGCFLDKVHVPWFSCFWLFPEFIDKYIKCTSNVEMETPHRVPSSVKQYDQVIKFVCIGESTNLRGCCA